jgi:hypothetical protein
VRERGADVNDAELVDEELRQLEQPPPRRRHVIAHVTHARGRRRDDDVLGEDALPAVGERLAELEIARVPVHLPAAGLLLREHDLVPEALEQRDDRPPGRREERVVEARDE